MIGYICVGAVVIILAVCVIRFYNKVIHLKNYVEEAFATMDVYLKKRADLVPNLVATIKGYAEHEVEIFASADRAIQNWNGNEKNRYVRFQAEEELAATVRDMNVLTERYPQICAGDNFLMLQKNLKSLEDDIANARKYYNGVVNTYNMAIATFPANLIAAILGFKKESLFKISDWDRDNTIVRF